MKKLTTLINLVLLSVILYAQAPQQLSYQAVIRDSTNNIVGNKEIGMQLSIIQGAIDGSEVYVETQALTTNINGLVVAEIGEGNVLQGDFNTINWGNGPYYIKSETDIEGGVDYTISITSKLLSVPYALYSNKSGYSDTATYANTVNYNNITNAPNISETINNYITDSINTNTLHHYVGELYGGGVVFWVDSEGEHGLIVCLKDLGYWTQWNNGEGIGANSSTGASSFFDGKANTDSIVNNLGAGNYAAIRCYDYTYDGFEDWYLPSYIEIIKLRDNILTVNTALESDNDPNSVALYIGIEGNTLHSYWSSTENSTNNDVAYTLTGDAYVKNTYHSFRAIRSF